MTQEKNGSKQLLWIGGGIAVCVLVSVFFFGLNRALACTEHEALDDKCKIRNVAIDHDIQIMSEMIKEIRDYIYKDKK